jgi:hypothetical protein
MSTWTLVLLLGVSAIWLALAGAIAYMVSVTRPENA